jgi:hypothetical protein
MPNRNYRAAMRLAIMAILVLGLIVEGTAAADDDPRNVCKELHCYCDGPDEPDTVGSCDNTCEQLCAGRSTGGGHQWATQRVSFGGFGGAGSSVVDTGGESAGAFTTGGDLRMVMGARPLLGIGLSFGVMVTATSGPGGGPDQTIAYVPLLVGLSSTPRLYRGKRVEFRIDLGADAGFLFGISCEGCKVNAFATQLRAGLDTYLGSTRTVGFAFEALYVPSVVATFNDTVEVRPPTVLFRLALIWRKSALLW